MAKVTRIPLGGKPGQRRIELPEHVQVSLAETASAAKQGLLAFAVAVGLDVFKTLCQEDVTGICGPKGKHDPDRTAYRHTRERSSVTLGGRKVAVDKPRVRSVAGEEVALPTWSAFSGDELLSEMALERMLAGLSTRRYEVGLEPVGDDLQATGTTRSSVSRRFVARTKVALSELMAKDLSELRIVALPVRADRPRDRGPRRCPARLDREPRLHRPEPAPRAGRRPRPPRRASRRPRSRAGGGLVPDP